MNQSFMLLQKIRPRYLLSVFLIFSNFWIYKILYQNLFAGILLGILTLIILLNTEKKITTLCLAVLILFQFQTTSIKSLTLLDNDEQRVQSERIKSYPPTYIDLGLKVIWLKPSDWIERNNLVIGLSKVEKNFFESLDLNKYFFGSFPRNKPEDFEKFPFAYLPFFILGVYLLIKKKNFGVLTVLFILPVAIMTYLGSDNRLGPFIIFPFFIKSFYTGAYWLMDRFKGKQIFYATFFVLIMLGFILQISYGKN